MLNQSCHSGAWGETGETHRKTFHISAVTAGGPAKFGAPGVAWRTFRSQDLLSSSPCSLCWWPQTAKGRGNTFKSVLLKLNSPVLPLGENVKKEKKKKTWVTIFFFSPFKCKHRHIWMHALKTHYLPQFFLVHLFSRLFVLLSLLGQQFAYVLDNIYCDCLHVFCIHHSPPTMKNTFLH